MWRFKYLLIGALISDALGAVLFFVGRYAIDEIKVQFKEDAVAAVRDGFAANELPPVTADRIVIGERQLTDALERADASSSTFSENGLAVDLVPGEIEIVTIDDQGDSTSLATVEPTIVDGRIELGEPGGFVGIVLPMGTIADEIELQAFNYFNANNVVPTSVEITDRELIIQVEPKPGATIPAARATPRATAQPGAVQPTPTAAATGPTPRSSATTPTPRVAATRTPIAATTSTPAPRVTPVGTLATAPTATRASLLPPTRTPTP